jgi:cystathionine beta-synthase
MQVFSNVLEMVGRTPMLEVTNIDTGPCRLFLKLEFANPGGSIKDRIGISMIEQAEKRGDIKPGDTIVEATAGNTGLGLALVAQQKGYALILVLPDKFYQSVRQPGQSACARTNDRARDLRTNERRR